MDFYWDGPLNSGPRSNIAFLPVLRDLYAEQHPGPALSLSPALWSLLPPPSGHLTHLFALPASLTEGMSSMKAETVPVCSALSPGFGSQ